MEYGQSTSTMSVWSPIERSDDAHLALRLKVLAGLRELFYLGHDYFFAGKLHDKLKDNPWIVLVVRQSLKDLELPDRTQTLHILVRRQRISYRTIGHWHHLTSSNAWMLERFLAFIVLHLIILLSSIKILRECFGLVAYFHVLPIDTRKG